MFSKFLSTKGTPPACPIFHFQLFSPMKKILPLFIACLLWFVGGLQAQNVPQGINYQTIVRGSDGDPATNASFKFLFEIKDGIGSLLYSETQTKSTNDYGLVNLQVGQGTPGFSFFNLIDWSNGPRTMTVSIETAPNIYTPLGTMQLMSVPFALYSAESATAQTLDHLGAQTGQVLKWNGSAWAPANDATGTGTVTQINTGTGLAGGPITNTGTITLTNTGVTSGIYGSATKVPVLEVDPQGRISNIGEADINSGAVTLNEGAGIDIGVNGQNNYTIINSGDLNPNDDVLQSTPHDGDVVGLYNNLQLKAGVVGAAEIANDAVNGNHIAPMGASAGQVLKYDGANWAPAQDLVGTNGNNYSPGQGIQITGNAPDFTITNSGDLSAANEGLLTVQAGNATSAVIASNTAGSTGVTIAAGAGIGIGESPAGNSITITNEGDTNPADDLTIASQAGGDVSGPFSNLQIAANTVTANEIANAAVNTGELADQSVTAAKLADQSVTAVKLANMNATNGQVLKFSGTSWAPDTDLTGNGNNYAAGNGIQITGSAPNFTISNTGDQNPNDDLTTASNAGGDVTGVFSNLQIATGAVTTNEIANATIVAADLAQMGAATGQVLRWNGIGWAPATLSGSGGILDCGDINSPQPEEAIAIGGVCQNNESQAYIRAIRSTSTVNGLDIRVVNEDTPDTDGANQRGILLNVQNGSNDNDGVIILSRANNGANGMKIATQSNGDDATGLRIFAGETDIDNINEDGNGTAQNYGVYVRTLDNTNNNATQLRNRDIGLYINAQNTGADWTAFFDGDAFSRDLYIDDDLFITNGVDNGFSRAWRFDLIEDPGVNQFGLSFFYNGTLKGYIDEVSGNYLSLSDARLKDRIMPLPSLIAKTMSLNPVSYHFKDQETEQATMGFISQEVEKIFPEMTRTVQIEEDQSVTMINYAGLSVIAIKTIQEQQVLIEKQTEKLATQEARLLSLEKEMAELKALFKASNEDKK